VDRRGKGRGSDREISLPEPELFECRAPRRGRLRDADAEDELARPKDGLPRPGIEGGDRDDALAAWMPDHDVGVEREQRGGEIRRCCGLATVRADRGVIEAMVAPNGVARARGAAALVALEPGPAEPPPLPQHAGPADRRHR